MSTDTVVTVAQTGLDAKRLEARAYLGTRWVGHHQYQFDPRHSTVPDIYVWARKPYLRSVEKAAAKARQANPAFNH